MDYVIDGQRAGEALHGFVRRWKYELTQGVEGELLDFAKNKLVDDLCRRVASNVDLPLDREPRPLRALLSARLMVFLANTTTDPEAELLRMAAAPPDNLLIAALFRKYLTKVRLPREWNGQPYAGR